MKTQIIRPSIKATISALLLSVFISPVYAKHDRVAAAPWNNGFPGAVVVGGTDGSIYTNAGRDQNWQTYNLGGAAFNAVIYANNKFVAVADSSTIWWSSDRKKWYSPLMPAGKASFSAVAYGEVATKDAKGKAITVPTFVAVANDYGTSYYSTQTYDNTGTEWTWKAGSNPDSSAALYDVIYAGNQFVAVGNNGAIIAGPAAYTSPDGKTWTPMTGLSGHDYLKAVTYASDKKTYVAVGQKSTIWRSTDGKSWKQATADKGGPSGSANFYDVTYSSGKFVAVADKGTIWTSQDATTWKQADYILTKDPDNENITSPGNTTFYSVASAVINNQPIFVAVGDNGDFGLNTRVSALWMSGDGWRWVPIESTNVTHIDPSETTYDARPLSAVYFDGTSFIAVPDKNLNDKNYYPAFFYNNGSNTWPLF